MERSADGQIDCSLGGFIRPTGEAEPSSRRSAAFKRLNVAAEWGVAAPIAVEQLCGAQLRRPLFRPDPQRTYLVVKGRARQHRHVQAVLHHDDLPAEFERENVLRRDERGALVLL
jgi:hypothetical protein